MNSQQKSQKYFNKSITEEFLRATLPTVAETLKHNFLKKFFLQCGKTILLNNDNTL